MEIKPHQISIRDLVEDYTDLGEDGIFGYNSRLNIRPAYQRELVYNDEEQEAVIMSVWKGFPINVMYWMDNENGTYELLDGQQRTLAICRYIDGKYPIELEGTTKFYGNLTPDQRNRILNYEITVYFCAGSPDERLDWFRTINIAGKKLTDQEIRNANYNGAWVTALKKLFSKTGCYAVNLGGKYLSGDSIRQEILENVLDWERDKDKVKSIDTYMAIHQNDPDAKEQKKYFTDIIDWIEETFVEYNPKMKGLTWGIYYNKYHNRVYDPQAIKIRVNELMNDPEVTRYKGIYEYILGGEQDETLLSLRQFDEPTKRAKYKQQKGICPICEKHFEYSAMHGDHIIPWSKGGTTTIDNCQMLCRDCNLKKGAQE